MLRLFQFFNCCRVRSSMLSKLVMPHMKEVLLPNCH